MTSKAAFFEQKMKEAGETKTNSQASKTNKTWTPNFDSSGVGAHSRDGYNKQTRAPPKKRSLADLP